MNLQEYYIPFVDILFPLAMAIFSCVPMFIPFKAKYLKSKYYITSLVFWGYVICCFHQLIAIYFFQHRSVLLALSSLGCALLWKFISGVYGKLIALNDAGIVVIK